MQNCVVCLIAQNFLLVGPYIVYNFSATMATIHTALSLSFGNCGLSKFFGDWKYASPLFGPCLLWPTGWMDHDITWSGDRHRPVDIVLDADPAPPARKGAQQPPLFCPQLRPASPQNSILPITPTVDYSVRGSRGNPMDNCHPSS